MRVMSQSRQVFEDYDMRRSTRVQRKVPGSFQCLYPPLKISSQGVYKEYKFSRYR